MLRFAKIIFFFRYFFNFLYCRKQSRDFCLRLRIQIVLWESSALKSPRTISTKKIPFLSTTTKNWILTPKIFISFFRLWWKYLNFWKILKNLLLAPKLKYLKIGKNWIFSPKFLSHFLFWIFKGKKVDFNAKNKIHNKNCPKNWISAPKILTNFKIPMRRFCFFLWEN